MRTLLWFESAAFAVVVLPVTIVVSDVARLSTLARVGIFVSPFRPDPEDENWKP